MTFLRVMHQHLTNFGLSLEDFCYPGRVLCHGRTLRRIEDIADAIEARVESGHTSRAVQDDVSRLAAEIRELLVDPYQAPVEQPSKVLALKRRVG